MLGSVEHYFCRFDLVIGAGRRWFNVDNHCVSGVDQIIEPIAELNPPFATQSARSGNRCAAQRAQATRLFLRPVKALLALAGSLYAVSPTTPPASYQLMQSDPLSNGFDAAEYSTKLTTTLSLSFAVLKITLVRQAVHPPCSRR